MNILNFKNINKKLEVILLLSLLLIGGLILVTHYNIPPINQSATNVTRSKLTTDSKEYTLLYSAFWQKFNTQAAIMADYNHDNMVSQIEIDLFKSQFLENYKLTMQEGEIFVLDASKKIVPPDKMSCYLKNYSPKALTQDIGTDNC